MTAREKEVFSRRDEASFDNVTFRSKREQKKKKLCPFFYSPDTVPSTGRLSTLGGGNPDI